MSLTDKRQRPLRPVLSASQSDGPAAPLSFAQERLWLAQALDPGSSIYNEQFALEFSGWLNTGALQDAINEILRRHTALRTTVGWGGDQPVQRIQSWSPNRPAAVVLDRLPEGIRHHVYRYHVMARFQQPFDLAAGPLVRLLLVRLNEREHALVVSIHHIACDPRSAGIFVDELAKLYAAFAEGKTSPLKELSIQYSDFARWERSWLTNEMLDQELDKRVRELSGAPAVTFPADYPRSPVWSSRAGWVNLPLSPALCRDLRLLSRKEKTTFSILLMAALNVLLYRYTGETEIVIGVPVENRYRREVDPLIGFFVNILILRVSLSGNPSFGQVLRRMHEVAFAAYSQQYLPYERLVRKLEIEGGYNQNHPFRVAWTFTPVDQSKADFPGLTTRSNSSPNGQPALFDIEFNVFESAQGVLCRIVYAADLFAQETIGRLAANWLTLLESLTTSVAQSILTLSVIGNAERQQVLVEWNQTAATEGSDSVQEKFEAEAARRPDAIAVGSEAGQLSYAELNRRVNQLAWHLRRLEVRPEVRVATFLERGPELIVALLGVLKAGGVYLPLDPTYPDERLAYMLADAEVRILLTVGKLGGRLESSGTRICLDTEWEHVSAERENNPKCLVKPRNLAYQIYTSGSTGRPKGVLIEHRGLINHLRAKVEDLGIGEDDVVAQNAPSSFDISIWQILTPLIEGSRVEVIEDELAHEGGRQLDYAEAKGVTVMETVPALLVNMVRHRHGRPLFGLRWMISNAEGLPPILCQQWLQDHPSVRLLNAYGPTECSDDVSHYYVERPVRAGLAYAPLARGLRNTQLYVLDEYGEPVPVGVSGELYIGGAGVGRGYLQRAGLTGEKFVPDQFGGEGGARMYRTGDRVRWLREGELEFQGRIDFQVKLRGNRIELGEIESALSEQTGVRQAVAVVRDERLVAYVVGEGDGSHLRGSLQARLPGYMVPGAIVMLEELPLTPNGKVDRKALPEPKVERTSGLVTPRTPAEEILAGIWAQILRRPEIGVNDNFFELGGDSILSLQVIARANQSGLRLTVQQLFQHQTIAELAEAAEPGGRSTTLAIGGAAPLTPMQHWLFEHVAERPDHFNQSVLLVVKPGTNLRMLRQAVEAVAAHHPVLDTRFTCEEGQRQQVQSDEPVITPLNSIDLSTLGNPERAMGEIAARLQASLSIENGPLMRAVSFELGVETGGRLLLIIHHLVVDGVSWRILLEDLQIAYAQLRAGEIVRLPAPTASFGQWAYRLAEYAGSEMLAAERDYWLAGRWHGIRPLPRESAGDNTRASEQNVAEELDREQTRVLLEDVPKLYRTQLQGTLLSAVVDAICEWTGEDQVLIELEGHGREEIFPDLDVSRTVGWFTSIVPVLLRRSRGARTDERLREIREQLQLLPRHGVGYGILRYLSPEAELRQALAGLPQAEILFNYLGQLDQVLDPASFLGPATEATGPEQSLSNRRSHPLEISAAVANGRLSISWRYSRNLHRRETIERLSQTVRRTLDRIIVSCQIEKDYSSFAGGRFNQQELGRILAKVSAYHPTKRDQS
jgi:amino acid adenylation domain-containing protein/non-ribosomal peptide synthase protein (TIGR01720 family)